MLLFLLITSSLSFLPSLFFSLSPGQRISYQFGDDKYGWSKLYNFTVPPQIGPKSNTRIIAYGGTVIIVIIVIAYGGTVIIVIAYGGTCSYYSYYSYYTVVIAYRPEVQIL